MKFALCALAVLAAGALHAADENGAPGPDPKDREISDKVVVQDVGFQAGKVMSNSYLALPKEPGAGPLPAVLVIHEWWGLNEYPKMRAEMLAELGYAALAVDLFGDRKLAHHPRQAGFYEAELMANRGEMHKRFMAAMKFMRLRPGVDRERIAAIGYGTGGDVVLQMARNGAVGLDGVAAFHPFFKVHLPNPPIDKLPAKILVCNAGEDPFVKLSKIAKFKQMMKDCQANMQFVDFPLAMQSFTVPNASKIGEKFTIPLVYREEDDLASWKVLQKFLAELWAEKPPAE